MKILLDRRSCKCWEPACESHFAWHFLGDEVTPIDCVVEIAEDGSEAITFTILDRDGIDKELVIDESNRAEAYDSWRQAWEVQHAAKNE